MALVRKWVVKVLRMRWVWFRPASSASFEAMGLLILNRWVLSYYKGSAVLWTRRQLRHLTPVDSIDAIGFAHIGDYVTRQVRK